MVDNHYPYDTISGSASAAFRKVYKWASSILDFESESDEEDVQHGKIAEVYEESKRREIAGENYRSVIEPMRKHRYGDYLNSPKWKRLRRRKIRSVGSACEACGIPELKAKWLDVHHLTYERFGKERMSDLQALCRKCHNKAHGKHQ